MGHVTESAVARALFERSPDAVVVSDLDGVILDANPAAVRLFRSEELSGQPIDRVIAARGGELDATSVDVDAGRLVFLRDVTELRHARKMETLGQLSAGIAHDFNNMLAVILARCALLAQDEDAIEIRAAADSARLLVRQLLAFGRKESLSPQRIAVTAAIEQFSRMLRSTLGDAIELVLELAPDAGAVAIDEVQFQQILLNLTFNARDAMPSGGRLTLATRGNGDRVTVEVSDTGTGMTDEVRARIFEPFFTTKDRAAGTGLGLATVADSVRQAGGAVEVTSVPGQGATFRLTFPRGEPAGEKPRPGRESLLPGGESVLIVDDDELVLRALDALLSRSGYQVIATRGAEQALAVARERPIDALVTDIVMPGTSGFALADAVRALRPAAKVLYLSGYGELPVDRRDDASRFLAKPFSAAELLRELRMLIDQS